MTCISPQFGYVAKDGSGQFTKSRKSGYIDRPLVISCGQCVGCRTERRRMWALRLMHELHFHSESMFVTLTYNEENHPYDGSLNKRDLQLFIKRYRKSIAPVRIRYFAVGEYGAKTYRPHYHLIIFGYREKDLQRYNLSGTTVYNLYMSTVIDLIWGKGQVVIADVNSSTCAYVAGYVTDKLTADDDFKRCDAVTGELYTVQPTFNLMSRMPGIGRNWYENFKNDVFPDDFCIQDGKKTQVPKYYSRLLNENDVVLAAKVRRGRVIRGLLRAQDRTPERLSVKETIYKSKLKSRGTI